MKYFAEYMYIYFFFEKKVDTKIINLLWCFFGFFFIKYPGKHVFLSFFFFLAHLSKAQGELL